MVTVMLAYSDEWDTLGVIDFDETDVQILAENDNTPYIYFFAAMEEV